MRLLRPELREVDLGQRLFDQPALLGLVERAADDLLGGEQRQVGDLVLDLLDRLARLGLDRLLAPAAMSRSRCAAASSRIWRSSSAPVRARPLDDLAGLAPRLRELLLVLVEQRLRLVARRARRPRGSRARWCGASRSSRRAGRTRTAAGRRKVRKKMTSVQIIRPGKGLTRVAGVVGHPAACANAAITCR